jgi:AcrR family transcriptional regulator
LAVSRATTASADSRPGLPRELDGFSERERILWSMVRVVTEKGLNSVTVTDVARRARVSRASFYDLFESRAECLLASFERVMGALSAYVGRAFATDDPWPVRMSRALTALLAACSAEAGVTMMATVDVPAAGGEARRRYRDSLKLFLPLLREGREYAARRDLPPDLELMAINGAEAIISSEVLAGRTKELPAVLPDLLFTTLVPFIGPEAAAAEVRRTRRFRPG